MGRVPQASPSWPIGGRVSRGSVHAPTLASQSCASRCWAQCVFQDVGVVAFGSELGHGDSGSAQPDDSQRGGLGPAPISPYGNAAGQQERTLVRSRPITSPCVHRRRTDAPPGRRSKVTSPGLWGVTVGGQRTTSLLLHGADQSQVSHVQAEYVPYLDQGLRHRVVAPGRGVSDGHVGETGLFDHASYVILGPDPQRAPSAIGLRIRRHSFPDGQDGAPAGA